MPVLKRSIARKANIRHVAEGAGVSLITASRAISGRGIVAEATRKRVLAVAQRLKYRPNRLVPELGSFRALKPYPMSSSSQMHPRGS